jgi:hypothetical protein
MATNDKNPPVYFSEFNDEQLEPLIQNAEAEIKERQKKQRDKEAMEEVKEIAASLGMTPKELILMKVLGALVCALAWVGLFLRYGRRPPERISQYLSSFGKAQAATGQSSCTGMLIPDMPREPWSEATRFPFHSLVESHHDGLVQEAQRIAQIADLPGYGLLRRGSVLQPTPQWKWWPLYEHRSGMLPDFSTEAPLAYSIAKEILKIYKGSVINVAYLVAAPGLELEEHVDADNAWVSYWRCLVVPTGDCCLKVAGEIRRLRVGDCFGFDNSFYHAAWNRTDSTRVVFEAYVPNPNLNDVEIQCMGFLGRSTDRIRRLIKRLMFWHRPELV